MPHIVLEYTSNIQDVINFNSLFVQIHRIIHDVINVPLKLCESQARQLEHGVIGEGAVNFAMIKLEISLLEGRSAELKRVLGEKVLDYLKSQYSHSIKQLDCQVIVRLIEINREHYFH